MEKSTREARLRQLCNQGISLTSNLYPKPIPDADVYEYKEKTEVQQLIPVEKIMGGNPFRIVKEKTWLGNLEAIDKERTWSGNSEVMDKERMDKLLDSLEEKGLNKFIASFQKDYHDPIDVGYYNDLDEYYVIEGSHRIILAKVIGIETIKARVIPHEFKPELLEKKKRSEQLEIEEKERFEKELQLLINKVSNLGLDLATEKDSQGKAIDIDVTYKKEFIGQFRVIHSDNFERIFDELEVLEALIDARRLLPDSLLLLNMRYFKLRKRSHWRITNFLDELVKSNYFK